jgi:hypothetical protein
VLSFVRRQSLCFLLWLCNMFVLMRSFLSKKKNQIEDDQALAGSTEPSSGSHCIESKCGLFSPSKCHSLSFELETGFWRW